MNIQVIIKCLARAGFLCVMMSAVAQQYPSSLCDGVTPVINGMLAKTWVETNLFCSGSSPGSTCSLISWWTGDCSANCTSSYQCGCVTINVTSPGTVSLGSITYKDKYFLPPGQRLPSSINCGDVYVYVGPQNEYSLYYHYQCGSWGTAIPANVVGVTWPCAWEWALPL
jgi:hypothetical protein